MQGLRARGFGGMKASGAADRFGAVSLEETPLPAFHRLISLLLLLASLLAAAPTRAAEEDFATWLAGFRQDALAAGIRPATLDRALAGVAPIPRVIELDRKQPEGTLTYEGYLERVVTPERRKVARERLNENRALLDEVAKRYGVQPRCIIALWGNETLFGKVTGNFPVISALATLAYDGRRSAFFRGELLNAIRMVDQYDVDPKEMIGSWAGAMGQSQFMPSSYLLYAVSYSGDGRRDIWHRREDVFASIANYLHQSGWHGDETWGRVVQLPAGFDPALLGLAVKKPLTDWRKLGVKRADGGRLPVRGLAASVLRPGGEQGPTILVYDNYRVLLKWNTSNYFATAVGFLADSME
jgi:membrane-bound lytic murein transglycosylase B